VFFLSFFFFFQAEDGIRVIGVTGVQTCALPILWYNSAVSPGPMIRRSCPIRCRQSRSFPTASSRAANFFATCSSGARYASSFNRSDERRGGKGVHTQHLDVSQHKYTRISYARHM